MLAGKTQSLKTVKVARTLWEINLRIALEKLERNWTTWTAARFQTIKIITSFQFIIGQHTAF